MRADRRKFHFVYITTCIKSGNYYIGLHSTDNLSDGYVGSGQRLWSSIKKYGKDLHKFEILEMFETRKEAAKYEKTVVTWDLIKQDRSCMNMVPGGEGGDRISNHPNRTEILAAKNYDWMKTEAYSLKLSESLKAKTVERLLQLQAQQSHMMKIRKENNYHHSLETKENISKNSKSGTEEVKLKIRKKLLGRKNPKHSKFQKSRFENKVNHPRIQKLIIISPEEIEFEVLGYEALTEFCKTNEISIQRLLKFRDQIVPNEKLRGMRKNSYNTAGWKLK